MEDRPLIALRRRLPAGSGSPAGFTLVEILVVIAILATLIGLVAAIIPMAMKKRQVLRTQTLVNKVGSTLELLHSDNDQYGKYPPSRTRDLRIRNKPVGKDIGQPNDRNAGIETIHFLCNNPDIQVDQVTDDPELVANTDEDSFRASRGTASDAQAREYLDSWGQPLAYFHSNDYKDPKGLEDVLSLDGRVIQVRPRKLPAKMGGGYMNPNSFQLFSVGPNGEQDPDDAEEGDDIWFTGR
jgi:prepilin-type N-terminal cleavage/methylation domain-containing protein